MEKLKVVFTGGGTGGHVYPNIAIYEALRESNPDASFLYIGTKKGAESRIVKNLTQPIDFVAVQSRGLPQSIKSLKTFIALFYILLGTIKSFFVLRKFKPDMIIGSGGYVAAPVLFAASLLRMKVFIHEQNAVPGRLNRFVARFATKIGVSFASTANYFPKDKVVVTGYPLRESIRFSKDENVRAKYKIPEKNKVVFVFGGSGGARSINNALAEVVPMLLAIEDLTVILSTGRGYSREYKAYDDTLKIFQDVGIGPEVEGRLIVREYFDNIDEIYSIADLVVSRAGAGTIKEITTLGVPSILIPKLNLPGDHQILNAREVEKIGGARIVYESVTFKDNKQVIYVPEIILMNTIRETVFDSDALFDMRKNLRQVEKQNSTDIILKELEQMVKGKEKSEETQFKVFYLQSREEEQNIELVFDTTSIGNSYLCDAFVDGIEEPTLMEVKVLKKKTSPKDAKSGQERIVVRRLKGHVTVDDEAVDNWTELKEDAQLSIGRDGKTFVLKCYFEKVQAVNLEKSTTSKVLGSSMGIMFSRLGGLFREMFIAAKFGAGRAMDIFAIGLTLANLMRRIVAENALENAFMPIYMRMFHRTSRKKTWEAASSIVNFTLLISALSTVLLILFTPLIVDLLFPSFVAKGMTTDTVNMTRIILPYLFLVTIAAVMTTYLKAFNRFGIAEASSVFFSVGVIAGILIFYSSSGLYSIAYGVLLGGLMQVLVTIPFVTRIFKLKSIAFSYKPVIDFDGPANKKYYSQLGPISLDVMLSKVAEVIGRVLAAPLGQGAISYLYLSLTIYRLPFAVISQAINSVVLREFSHQIALFDKKKAKQLFIDGVKTNVFLLAPVTVLLIILAEPIVSILLQRGEFDTADMVNTAYALQFYSLGLIGWGIHSLTVRIFSARIDIKTSMILNAIMLALNIGLSFWLVNTSLTFAGLALATSIAFVLFAGIRVAVLKVKLDKDEINIRYREFLTPFFKTLISTALMVLVLMEAKFIFQQIKFTSPFVSNLILLISLSFIGFSVYLLSSLMLKNTELLIFKRKLLKKAPAVPVSMLSPFKFLEKVSRDGEAYRDDYFYKINVYLSSGRWEIRNVGIKLIGLFKDTTKVAYLLNVLRSRKENGFVKRNTIYSLLKLSPWNAEIKKLMIQLLSDSYYEVRVAAMSYLTKNCTAGDYDELRETVRNWLKRSTMEEKVAALKLIAKIGDKEDADFMKHLYLSGNSLIREELLESLYGLYRRKLLNAETLREHIAKILITSNNLSPEFKLKSIIKKIYKEIEKV